MKFNIFLFVGTKLPPISHNIAPNEPQMALNDVSALLLPDYFELSQG